MPGAGSSGAGFTDAGYGSVDQAPLPSKDLFKDPFAPRNLTCRRIDPVTRDYVMGPTGNLQGMTSAQQAVELAILTELGSSCLPTMGNDLKEIKVISESFDLDVQGRIRKALDPHVASGLIEIVSIKVTRIRTNGAFVVTRWRDRSTSHEQETTVGL